MCASSRSSNAGEPSGSVARSSRATPSDPADRAEAQESEVLPLPVREAVPVGREALTTELVPHERLRREHSQGVRDERGRHDDRDEDDQCDRRDAKRG
jgi:hypothetical protein